MLNCRGEVAALRKLKKEWEACGTVVTDLCATMTAAMDETDVRVSKVGVPWLPSIGDVGWWSTQYLSICVG